MPGIGGVTISPLIKLGSRGISLTFTTNASTDAQNQSWDVKFPVGKSITVDWGDGNTDTIIGNGIIIVNFTHTYATVAARTINIKSDYVLLTYISSFSNGLLTTSISSLVNLTYLILYNNSLTDIGNLSSLVNLTSLNLAYNSLTDIGNLSSLVNLTYLILAYNSLTDIGNLSGLVNLTYLNLAGNSLTDIGNLSGLVNLTYLNLAGNSLTAWTFDHGSVALSVLNYQNNLLPTSELDLGLSRLKTFYVDGDNAPTVDLTLDISGTGNGIPTGGSSNTDLVALSNYFSSKGKILIATVNS
jgi:hypothetical protein